MTQYLVKTIATCLGALAVTAAATSPGMTQMNSCPDSSPPQTYSATVEAEGLENAQSLATDSLFNLLARNGAAVTMTSRIYEPECYFTEVGNNVRCVANADICP